MTDHPTRRLDDPAPEGDCPKCGGLMKAAALQTTMRAAAEDGRQRFWDFSGFYTKVCRQCGYTEFYVQHPEKF